MKAFKKMFAGTKEKGGREEDPAPLVSPPGPAPIVAPPTDKMAAITVSAKDDGSPLSFRELNSQVVKQLVAALDPSMRRSQVDKIMKGLVEAKEMFKANKRSSVHESYRLGKLLGTGAFAKVMSGVNRKTGEHVAIKVIQKQDPADLQQRPDILKEVAIMSMLRDHPNTAICYDCYEDNTTFVLVCELCKGGELFDAIVKRHHLTEKDAAAIMKQIGSVVQICHELGIIHRDLKPENVLLKDSSSLHIKVIDFGTSSFCGENQVLTQQFGTPYYVAPEVLNRAYNCVADVWSSGVIMYILLCGYPPFGGRNDDAILQKIVVGKYSFSGKEWDAVSAEAKDLISKMLVLDTRKRLSANGMVGHSWFRTQEQTSAANSNPIGNLMMDRLRQFGGMQRMKRLALACLVKTLNNRDVKSLLELFEAKDPERTGFLDHDAFHEALARVGAVLEHEQLESMLDLDVNTDKQGRINYNDFVAAMLDTTCVTKKREAVRRSFEALDTDGDGKITPNDIVKASGGRLSVEAAREMVGETVGREVGADEDAEIDYATFEKMMRT